MREVKTPDGKEGVVMVGKMQAGDVNRKYPRSKAWIDHYSGKVLEVQDPNKFSVGETFLNLMWPLHNAEALGFVGRVTWCAMGFAPLILYVGGIIRWRQKRKAQKFHRKQESTNGKRSLLMKKN